MPVDDIATNPSANRPFEDVLYARISRRKVLGGSLATGATIFFGAGTAGALTGRARPGRKNGHRAPLIGFTPVPVAGGSGPLPAVSADYEYQVLIPGASRSLRPTPSM